jgi:hypothetical protein
MGTMTIKNSFVIYFRHKFQTMKALSISDNNVGVKLTDSIPITVVTTAEVLGIDRDIDFVNLISKCNTAKGWSLIVAPPLCGTTTRVLVAKDCVAVADTKLDRNPAVSPPLNRNWDLARKKYQTKPLQSTRAPETSLRTVPQRCVPLYFDLRGQNDYTAVLLSLCAQYPSFPRCLNIDAALDTLINCLSGDMDAQGPSIIIIDHVSRPAALVLRAMLATVVDSIGIVVVASIAICSVEHCDSNSTAMDPSAISVLSETVLSSHFFSQVAEWAAIYSLHFVSDTHHCVGQQQSILVFADILDNKQIADVVTRSDVSSNEEVSHMITDLAQGVVGLVAPLSQLSLYELRKLCEFSKVDRSKSTPVSKTVFWNVGRVYSSVSVVCKSLLTLCNRRMFSLLHSVVLWLGNAHDEGLLTTAGEVIVPSTIPLSTLWDFDSQSPICTDDSDLRRLVVLGLLKDVSQLQHFYISFQVCDVYLALHSHIVGLKTKLPTSLSIGHLMDVNTLPRPPVPNSGSFTGTASDCLSPRSSASYSFLTNFPGDVSDTQAQHVIQQASVIIVRDGWSLSQRAVLQDIGDFDLVKRVFCAAEATIFPHLIQAQVLMTLRILRKISKSWFVGDFTRPSLPLDQQVVTAMVAILAFGQPVLSMTVDLKEQISFSLFAFTLLQKMNFETSEYMEFTKECVEVLSGILPMTGSLSIFCSDRFLVVNSLLCESLLCELRSIDDCIVEPGSVGS